MPLVVDASVALPWFFQQPETARAEALLRERGPLIAPELIIFEITNAAWKAVALEGRPVEAARDTVREASRFLSELVPAVALKDRALMIALELRHSAYDCFYLALAEMRSIELVTADGRLRTRCAGTRFERLVRLL
jgi:predicted nucleic acid-binding protein